MLLFLTLSTQQFLMEVCERSSNTHTQINTTLSHTHTHKQTPTRTQARIRREAPLPLVFPVLLRLLRGLLTAFQFYLSFEMRLAFVNWSEHLNKRPGQAGRCQGESGYVWLRSLITILYPCQTCCSCTGTVNTCSLHQCFNNFTEQDEDHVEFQMEQSEKQLSMNILHECV